LYRIHTALYSKHPLTVSTGLDREVLFAFLVSKAKHTMCHDKG